MVKGVSLATPLLVMIADLKQVLQGFHIPFALNDACTFLEWVRSAIDYLVVYQHYFPAEYAESMEVVRLGQVPFFPQRGEAYSPHEEQLLKLVDNQLFPLPLWYLLEDACEENRCFTIPIEPFGIDLSVADELLEMDLGWQLLYYLIGTISAGFFADSFNDERDELFAVPIEEGRIDDESLRTVCEREGEPLAFLRHAIDLIGNDTGSVWLDTTREMPCEDAAWSIEIIDELVKQYADALDIKEKADQFINWLEGDLIPHFKEVIRVWNACVTLTKQKQER